MNDDEMLFSKARKTLVTTTYTETPKTPNGFFPATRALICDRPGTKFWPLAKMGSLNLLESR